jgi:ribosomal protein S18 acetylase RimI-like enzyme
MIYRSAISSDIPQLTKLALNTWSEFKSQLSDHYWTELHTILSTKTTYTELLDQSYCLICENSIQEIVGMIFLVSSGNPTELYHEDWCYIRFLTVRPEYKGRGIGKQLTLRCIEHARRNNENTMALHTSEMMSQAIQLYTRLGFQLFKEIPSRLGKKYWLYTLQISQ